MWWCNVERTLMTHPWTICLHELIIRIISFIWINKKSLSSVLKQQCQEKNYSSWWSCGTKSFLKIRDSGDFSFLWFGSCWHETLGQPCSSPTLPPCCRLYVSAHWSPTGRWLRKHVQERDGSVGSWGGVVMRRHWCLGCRGAIRHAALPAVWSQQPNFEWATTW